MAIENLAPVYKVINLVDFDDKKIQALLPKLATKKLPITILHKSRLNIVIYQICGEKLFLKIRTVILIQKKI